jgi:hypothetical protein
VGRVAKDRSIEKRRDPFTNDRTRAAPTSGDRNAVKQPQRGEATATRLSPTAQGCRPRLPWESDRLDIRQPQRGCVPQPRVAAQYCFQGEPPFLQKPRTGAVGNIVGGVLRLSWETQRLNLREPQSSCGSVPEHMVRSILFYDVEATSRRVYKNAKGLNSTGGGRNRVAVAPIWNPTLILYFPALGVAA